MAPKLTISLHNDNFPEAIDSKLLKKAVRLVCKSGDITSGEISLAIVSNEKIHTLNQQYLQHDFPTDVLSFCFELTGTEVCGEVIASAEYAATEAAHYGWPAEHELLLYFVHGTLHLIGYDDQTPAAAERMRAQERAILGELGLHPPGRD
jgi:probable rRNA maturation factor